jgi:hypothetical protein
MPVLHAAQKTANKHLKSPHRYPVNPDRASIPLFFRRLLEPSTCVSVDSILCDHNNAQQAIRVTALCQSNLEN